MAHNRKTLIGIGLEDAASWKLTTSGLKTVGDKAARWRRLTARPDALYAFCSGDKVLYVGRSTTTLSKRFATLGNTTDAPFIKRSANFSWQVKRCEFLLWPTNRPSLGDRSPLILQRDLKDR